MGKIEGKNQLGPKNKRKRKQKEGQAKRNGQRTETRRLRRGLDTAMGPTTEVWVPNKRIALVNYANSRKIEGYKRQDRGQL